jgi:lipopolysaccharide/colanic/teichoic acid biosynthesis glycosyltransferase
MDGVGRANVVSATQVREAGPHIIGTGLSAPAPGAAHPGVRPERERRSPEPLVPALSRSKRAFDLVIAVSLALLLAPAMTMIAILVRIDSPGPVFFQCRRVGFGGRVFSMLKFRKMHQEASGAELTTHADDRFTRAGRWLAKLKADELPQLWHVIRGDMSLVGPRPESPHLAGHYANDHAEVTRVRPGIVGLSQLAFAEESRILDTGDPVGHYLESIFPQKLALDRLYAERWTLWLDIRIVLWTAAAVILRRPVAVDRATGRMGLRKR